MYGTWQMSGEIELLIILTRLCSLHLLLCLLALFCEISFKLCVCAYYFSVWLWSVWIFYSYEFDKIGHSSGSNFHLVHSIESQVCYVCRNNLMGSAERETIRIQSRYYDFQLNLHWLRLNEYDFIPKFRGHLRFSFTPFILLIFSFLQTTSNYILVSKRLKRIQSKHWK